MKSNEETVDIFQKPQEMYSLIGDFNVDTSLLL